MIELDYAELVGYAATLCTASSVVPQVIKCLTTKQTKDVSLGTWLLVVCGSICWTIYGISKGSIPLILTNTLVGVGAGIILTAKARYG